MARFEISKESFIVFCLCICVLFFVYPRILNTFTYTPTNDIRLPENAGTGNKPADTERSQPNQKKYVYIDLGARNGDTINWYLKTYPKRVPSVIWAFEANPQNFELMDTYWQKQKNLDIRIIKKAAWIDNKGVEFTLDNRPDVLTGGSMFNHNQAYLKNTKKVKIESVDFSSWLMSNTAATDDILIKMDIEGAEYDILDKMFIDGTINRVKTIIIEWHDRFMPGKHHSYLTKKLRKLNIGLIEWH